MSTQPIQTVLGPIEPDALGRTLCHEHVFVLSPDAQTNVATDWDEDRRVADAIDKLRRLKANGIDAIIDPTVIGLGRYVPRVREIAEQTDLHIVIATGLYTYDTVPFFFAHRGPGTNLGGPDPLVDAFVTDITEGVPGTDGVRAGIIKVATDKAGVTPDIDRILRAAAAAHRQTGVPITTHTDAHERVGLDQQRVFDEEGVDLSRVVIGHSGDTDDYDYLEEMLRRGSYLGMDRFGVDTMPMAERVDVVVQLIERGWVDQLLLAHDAACYVDWFGDWDLMMQLAPNWNFDHIPNDVLPALRDRGVTEQQIDAMLVDNPRRLLAENRGPY